MSKSHPDDEFPEMLLEAKGSMAKGRLKFADSGIIFKNSKTGKVEQIASGDVDGASWQRFAGKWGIRVFSKSGALHRFGGFKEDDRERVAKFFSSKYSNKMLERELSLKGWNWGTAKFSGNVLTFDVGRDSAFDVPLSYVSQCNTGKNEVTLEFHQNDDAPVSLMEMRFHIPSSELAGDDPVEAFRENVMEKASIISATGDAIAIFREIQCLTPRGRYDIKMFPTFFQLHGKTFDYKIPMSTILRMFLLPHKDGRQTFFVISLDPPIKQGQTRYHYLVCLFSSDDEDTTIELPFSEKELQTKFDGKLSKELSGPTFDVIGRVFKALVNRKITVPGKFTGHSGTAAVGCSYKAAAGYMYPLDRGFIYVHKPPLHIRFEELASVNFARSGGSTRSFDFEVETKSGIVHTFSSIEKEEYPRLFDFITEKKLRVKNRGKLDKPVFTGDYEDSDAEQEPDAYLARVKAEAEERSDDGEEESSEDDDYDPDKDKNKPKDDDSSAISSSAEEGSEYDADEIGSDMEPTKKKREKKAKKSKEGSSKKKSKRSKDDDAPKRPMAPYMLWMNANRDSIKKKNPDLSMTEISKKAGELWRGLSSEDKKEWEEKHKKNKQKYEKEMEEYRKTAKPSSSPDRKKSSKASSSSKSTKKSSPKKKGGSSEASGGGGGGGGFKSKEFISDSDSSEDSDASDKKSKKPKKQSSSKAKSKSDSGSKAKVKKEKSESEDSASGSATPSDSD